MPKITFKVMIIGPIAFAIAVVLTLKFEKLLDSASLEHILRIRGLGPYFLKGLLFGIFPSIILALFISYAHKSRVKFVQLKFYSIAAVSTHITSLAIVLYDCWRKNRLWPKEESPDVIRMIDGLPYGCGTRSRPCDYFALNEIPEMLAIGFIAASILLILARVSLQSHKHIASNGSI